MRKRSFVLSIIILGFMVGVMYLSSRPHREGRNLKRQAEDVFPKEENLSQKTSLVSDKTLSSGPSITPEMIESFRATLPHLRDVKNEVRENPHRTPALLMNFAKGLGPLVESALKSHRDAELLVDELQDCAYNNSIAQSARALCIAQIDRLAGKYPEFKKDFEEMKKSLPDISKLQESKNTIIEK